MHDEEHDRQHEHDVNQRADHVENHESANPGEEQKQRDDEKCVTHNLS